jgi:MYXO-CTERM domain-containing protein
MPPVFAASDTVERLDSPRFRIHYTRAGSHAVPADDADRDGTPDYVQEVAREYEAVRAFYRDELGFLEALPDDAVPEDNGGDGRFDVYLLDFPTTADGAFRQERCLTEAASRCTGYMLHENDFARRSYPSRQRATRILASHEYFHAIQNAYDARAGVVLGEGTAVWASEAYDDSLGDLEGFARGYLGRPERSLGQEPSGPVDEFSYGSAIFFQFLSERFDPSLVRELWQGLLEAADAGEPPALGSSWHPVLDRVLQREHASSLAQAFAEFTRWNLYTGPRADPTRSYRSGAMYPEVSSSVEALPFNDASVRVFPLSARFYRATLERAQALTFALGAGDTGLAGLELILARESEGRIEEIASGDAAEETTLSLELEAGDVVHAVVLNTRASGESLRPALCLGDAAAVKRCRGEPSPTADGGTNEQDDAASERDAPDGGCSAAASGGGAARSGWAGWLGLAVGLAFVRRRKRAARTAAED